MEEIPIHLTFISNNRKQNFW